MDIMQFPSEVFNFFRSKFSISHYPLIMKLKQSSQKQFKNRYYEMNHYANNDPAVYGSLKFIALTVSDAYKPLGHEIQKEVRDIVFNLMTFGDVIITKYGLQLPLYNLSILDDKKRIGNANPDPVITNAQYYIINEFDNNRKIYSNSDVIQLSLFPQGHMITDIYDRWTYSVYGRAPMLSLLKLLAWKDKLIDDDILIKDRMVPREVHKVDVRIPPNLTKGKTPQETLELHSKFVDNILEDYRTEISDLGPGEHYVVTQNVDIDVLESKVNYSTPNELLEQLTQHIIGVFNVPQSAVLGSSKSSYASELAVASYYTVQANALAGLINEYLRERYPEKEERLDNINVVLDIWKDSIYKRIALLIKGGVITKNEAREMIGLNPMEELIDTVSENVNIENIDGRIIAGLEREGPIKYEPNTPLSEDNRNDNDEYRKIESNEIRNMMGDRNDTNNNSNISKK